MKHMYEDFDEEATKLVQAGINPIGFEGLKTAITSDDSRMINFDERPKVIISASGMCEAGRIRHHLKHNLWRKESTILFVGYQAKGTLGRIILEGAKSVNLFGEEIEIQAEIRRLTIRFTHDQLIITGRTVTSTQRQVINPFQVFHKTFFRYSP